MNNQIRLPDETRFNRQSYLVLLFGLFLLTLPLVLILLSFAQPTDGWAYTRSDDGIAEATLFQGATETPLQVSDLILKVNGQTLDLAASTVPSLPTPLHMGQLVSYTIERNGQSLDVVVTLIPRVPAAILWSIVASAQNDIAGLVVPILYLLIGVFVLWQRPGQVAAHYLFLLSVVWFSIVYGSAGSTFYRAFYPNWLMWPTQFFGAALWAWLVFPILIRLMLSFPVEKGILRRFPRLLPTLLHGVPALAAVILLWQYSQTRDAAYIDALQIINVIAILTFLVVLIVSLVHSFRSVQTPTARAQLLWFAFGMIGGIGLAALIYALGVTVVTDPGLSNLITKLIGWVFLALPLSLAIAITRYRLFDIDVIIRKTLVYSVLSGLLALVYFGMVVLLQSLFDSVSGQQSPIAIVISTLVIAALFAPLRRRIQDVIDRRFYRKKYNAQQVLAQFAQTCRDETDMDKLKAELIRVVQETMQPETVSVWFKETRR
jgi:hypothetical protein